MGNMCSDYSSYLLGQLIAESTSLCLITIFFQWTVQELELWTPNQNQKHISNVLWFL
jgi:hypothetical protein